MSNINLTKINTNEKILKYIILGLIVAILTKYIPNYILTRTEIIIISSLSVVAFAILDIISPAVKININKKTINDTSNLCVIE
jgi:threonine/homoserine efflux transporter RhtA